jgi:hypothetical protein
MPSRSIAIPTEAECSEKHADIVAKGQSGAMSKM